MDMQPAGCSAAPYTGIDLGSDPERKKLASIMDEMHNIYSLCLILIQHFENFALVLSGIILKEKKIFSEQSVLF